jgi:isoamylase
VLELRRTLRRNLLASLLLAQGVPLLLAGDEVGNSQKGNNNAFCQDNEVGWVDWSGLGRPGDDLTEFIGRLSELRRKYPQLRPRRWLVGRRPDSSHDVLWLTPRGTEMTDVDWQFPKARYLSYVLGPPGEHGAPLFIVLNAAEQPIDFILPACPRCSRWMFFLATVATKKPAGAEYRVGAHCEAPPRSVLVFEGAE